MSVWKFKPGQREKALAELDKNVSDQAKQTRGYHGFLQLLSKDDADVATIITLWEDENALSSSAKGVFTDAVQTLDQYVANQPNVSNYVVNDSELRL